MTALAPNPPTVVTATASEASLGQRARRDAAVRTGAFAVLWLSLLLVTYWWVTGRGIQDLAGWDTGLTSVGRWAGLIASVLLLTQTVLMARIPLLEKAFGQDRLAKIHRLTGLTSFTLMVLHVLTITWGYAGGALPQIPSTFWDLSVNYPGMLLAVAGTVSLVMVVVTSVKAARRRLRYESWHLMHLYAYLGVGLALPHQMWTGNDFIGSFPRTVFWWTAWGATVAAVLIWRLGLPVVTNLRHQLRVVGVRDEAPGIWSVEIRGRNLDRLRIEPGQFFSWRFRSGAGWTRANPYSLSAPPTPDTLRITVQDNGTGSAATRSLRPGTRVLIEGPFGRLSPRARTRRKLAFIGAGVGITPLRALAEGSVFAPGDAIYIERCSATPLFPTEVDRLAAARGMQVLRLQGPRRAAGSWLPATVGTADDLTALRYWIPDVAERDVYLCGPEPWLDLVTQSLRAAGVPDDHLHLETFAW